MGFAQDSGYTPVPIATIMASIMDGVNTQFGTSYTADTFLGTNHYKFYYALAQRVQQNEIKTSEIFTYLQQYFAITNERIQRPVATNPGLIENLAAAGWTASVKPTIDADAGKLYVCVDVDDGVHASGTVTITSYANLVSGTHDTVTVNGTAFTAQATSVTPGGATFQAVTDNSTTAASLAAQINAHAVIGLLVKATAVGAVVTIKALLGGTGGNALTLAYADLGTSTIGATVSGATLTGGTTRAAYADDKLAINTLIKDSTAAGIVSQGTQTSTIVLSNGQNFDFKFNLPNKIDVHLRLTTVLSDNNQVVILSPEDQKALLLANIAAKYRLGRDFEPQRYFTTADAPWTASVLLEWSYDAITYFSTIYQASYNDIFEVTLANTAIVED